MKKAQLPLWHRLWLMIALTVSWGTGTVLVWAHYFGRAEGAFGPETHWVESPARALHGLMAFVCLIALGALVPLHFRSGWITGTRRASALMMAITAMIMILTGWGLYYAGGDSLRQGLRFTHSGLGLLLLPLFFVHSRLARKSPKALMMRKGPSPK